MLQCYQGDPCDLFRACIDPVDTKLCPKATAAWDNTHKVLRLHVSDKMPIVYHDVADGRPLSFTFRRHQWRVFRQSCVSTRLCLWCIPDRIASGHDRLLSHAYEAGIHMVEQQKDRSKQPLSQRTQHPHHQTHCHTDNLRGDRRRHFCNGTHGQVMASPKYELERPNGARCI